jgi:hypothetical protein
MTIGKRHTHLAFRQAYTDDKVFRHTWDVLIEKAGCDGQAAGELLEGFVHFAVLHVFPKPDDNTVIFNAIVKDALEEDVASYTFVAYRPCFGLAVADIARQLADYSRRYPLAKTPD